jgi:hypothetical protein
MSTRAARVAKRLVLAGACLVCLAGLWLAYLWRWGLPAGDPEWSPNRQFYVQHYQNLTPRMFEVRPPGDGAVSDGYVRVYDRRRGLLWERYYRNNLDMQPTWSGRTLWLSAGIGREDSVALPASAE